jgi:hypothetical protein
MLEQPRSTQRYVSNEDMGEKEMVKVMCEIAQRHLRYGTPRSYREPGVSLPAPNGERGDQTRQGSFTAG